MSDPTKESLRFAGPSDFSGKSSRKHCPQPAKVPIYGPGFRHLRQTSAGRLPLEDVERDPMEGVRHPAA